MLSANSSVSLSVSGFGSSWNASGQIPERAVASGEIDRFGAIDPTEGGTTQRRNVVLSYVSDQDGNKFEMQAYQAQYRFKLFSNFTFFLDDAVLGDGIEQVDNRTMTGLNAKYTLAQYWGNTPTRLTFGGSYRSDDIENGLYHQKRRTRLDTRAHANIQQQSVSAFVKNEWQLSDRFRAELGLRSDYFIFDVDDLMPVANPDDKGISGYNYQTLLSPKLNLSYSIAKTKLFFNSGRGFHSNDARSVVRDQNVNVLPSAWGAEVGAQWTYGNTMLSTAFWGLHLDNELVYIGDAGETEDKGASRRMGIDFSVRTKLYPSLYFDADVNLSDSRLLDQSFGQVLETGNYIPLAPRFTTTGGFTWKSNKGFDASLRARHLAARPANEDNSVRTREYTVVDASCMYNLKSYRFGFTIENLLNTEWNEAQFATESRLKDELNPVEEIHFTPGTPFSIKFVVAYKSKQWHQNACRYFKNGCKHWSRYSL